MVRFFLFFPDYSQRLFAFDALTLAAAVSNLLYSPGGSANILGESFSFLIAAISYNEKRMKCVYFGWVYVCV